MILFLGSFLYELIVKNNIKNVKELKNIPKEILDSAVEFANVAGSLSTRSNGAIPSMPSPDDILAYMKRRNNRNETM